MRAQQVKLEAYCLMKDWMLNRVIRDEGYSSKTLKCPAREEITVMVTSHPYLALSMTGYSSRLTVSKNIPAASGIDVKRTTTLNASSGSVSTTLTSSSPGTTSPVGRRRCSF